MEIASELKFKKSLKATNTMIHIRLITSTYFRAAG